MKTRELTELYVDEISLVDKAANKRKFLLYKRDNSQGGDSMDGLEKCDGVDLVELAGNIEKAFNALEDGFEKRRAEAEKASDGNYHSGDFSFLKSEENEAIEKFFGSVNNVIEKAKDYPYKYPGSREYYGYPKKQEMKPTEDDKKKEEEMMAQKAEIEKQKAELDVRKQELDEKEVELTKAAEGLKDSMTVLAEKL